MPEDLRIADIAQFRRKQTQEKKDGVSGEKVMTMPPHTLEPVFSSYAAAHFERIG
ncbi:hypothetical protein [Variovorax boronicumulans]|uniref:hypothetical protein n=1 Tax=Variovorax boronicumulans TaxID=436515 RepID=UPI0015541132